jgi:exopolysaccharide production protein ExoY
MNSFANNYSTTALSTISSKKTDSSGIPLLLQRTAALAAILVLLPVLVFTYLAVRINSKGPAIFRQVRIGKQGRHFTMYKFRSMYLTSDARYQAPGKSDRGGVCEKFFNDPRITAVGKIIRKLSIDELPQLFNVLFGNMALIGPRPALPKEVAEYQRYMLNRLDVEPGITGLWQVSGRADISFSEQIKLDFKYVQERSFFMDVKILFATIPAVLTGKGAY